MALYRYLRLRFAISMQGAPFQGLNFLATQSFAPIWMALFAILTGKPLSNLCPVPSRPTIAPRLTIHPFPGKPCGGTSCRKCLNRRVKVFLALISRAAARSSTGQGPSSWAGWLLRCWAATCTNWSSRLVVNQAALKLKREPLRRIIDAFAQATGA